MISSFHKASVLQGLAVCTFLLGMPLGTPARRAPELPNAPSAPAVHTSLGAPPQTTPGVPSATSPPAGDAPQVPTPLRAQMPLPPHEEEPGAQITRKQKRDLLKQNFEKMKRDAEELATLAKALQEELAKSNENVLSFQVVTKAEKIEKLAKRIKSTARGY